MEAKTKSGTFLAESCGKALPPNGSHHPKVPFFYAAPYIAVADDVSPLYVLTLLSIVWGDDTDMF